MASMTSWVRSSASAAGQPRAWKYRITCPAKQRNRTAQESGPGFAKNRATASSSLLAPGVAIRPDTIPRAGEPSQTRVQAEHLMLEIRLQPDLLRKIFG